MLSKKNMFSWLKFIKKKISPSNDQQNNNCSVHDIEHNTQNTLKSLFYNIKNVKNSFFFKIKQFFLNNKINSVFFEKLEDQLLKFDFGVIVSKKIVNVILEKYKNHILKHESDVYLELKNQLLLILDQCNIHDNMYNKKIQNNPYVIFLIGVNGVGKTTTAAKLAYFYKNSGKSVALVAGDTFREAAIEQIKYWGDQLSIPVFFKKYGTDPSSVIFDSIEFARYNKIDILIIDTAGRMHNKINLISELQKNIRIIKKKIFCDPNEILLVLDVCNGQNSFVQTELFHQKITNITGIILTKLDGTAKGGIIFSISEKFSIPIQYFGNGEQLTDFYKFRAKNFINDMFE